MCGNEHVDYQKALSALSTKYGTKMILVDSGPTLNRVLLSKCLMDEISLLFPPILVGGKSDRLLAHLNNGTATVNLELMACEVIEKELILLRYEVPKGNP